MSNVCFFYQSKRETATTERKIPALTSTKYPYHGLYSEKC